MGFSEWVSVVALTVSILSAAVSLYSARMQYRCDAALRIKTQRSKETGARVVHLELVADSRSDTQWLWVKGVKGTTLHASRYVPRAGSPTGFGVNLEIGDPIPKLLVDELVERSTVSRVPVVVTPASDGTATLVSAVRCDRLPWRARLTATARLATSETVQAVRVT
jgi:hypothetical protein